MKNFICLFFIFVFSVSAGFADVRVSWTPQSSTGFTPVEKKVYRWAFDADESSAVEIGAVPEPQNQLVIPGTAHPDGVFNYCVRSFEKWVTTNEVISSSCSVSVPAVIIGGVVKKTSLPLAPADLTIN